MKGFKTYVITRKTLVRYLIIIALAVVSVTSVIIHIKKQSTDCETAAVFEDFAENIIDEGVADDSGGKTLRDIVAEILGFDSDNAESIIDSSSSSFRLANNSEPTPAPTPETTVAPVYTPEPETPSETIATLPTHEQIINSVGLELNNATDYAIDINEMCKNPSDIKLTLNEPEVLVMHTHTTECYDGDSMSGESERTTNESYNMCKLGDILCDTLAQYGIIAIHDKTIHDYPSYQGSYTRAMKTIEKNIAENPSIKVVIDLHRDAYVYSDGSKLKVSTSIDGTEVAKAMLVLGTDSMGLSHDNWRSNLTFAAKIQNAAEIMYPTLMRPINLRRERFNMHATNGSILVEIGSNGNSLSEAEKTAEYLGCAIAAALLNG